MRILFVCMGNICRSPTAECMMRMRVADAALEKRVEIDSAGTIDLHTGNPPDRRMIAAGRRRGLEITGSARQIRPVDFHRFDLILCADRENLADVEVLHQACGGDAGVRLICEFCIGLDLDEVPDPYYGGEAGFDAVLDILEDACAGILRSIDPAL